MSKLLALKKLLWPDVVFSDEQTEAILSVERDDETVLVAGNQLGKDYVAGFIVLAFFLTRHPCRIVTTSVKDKHLNVLWGEIGEFIRTSKYPLNCKQGGPLVINHQHLRKIVSGEQCPLSYVITLVANPENTESFQGHHVKPPPGIIDDGVPRSMFVTDEASGVSHAYYVLGDTWASRKLIFGNPWPCQNFFKHAVKGNPETKDPGGDMVDPNDSSRFYRKIIRIQAVDSPNVKLGLIQESKGRKPTNETIVPGLVTYRLYKKHRQLWDKIKQCVALDAEFYEGAENLLFPPEWLNAAEELATKLEQSGTRRKAETMGIDPAEGGDSTVYVILDRLGIVKLHTEKTPDTSVITGRTVAFIKEYNLKPENVLLDRGGGGYEHACVLRRGGYNVRTVAFGAAATAEMQRGTRPLKKRKEEDEIRYVYKNRRAEMYGLVSLLLDPEEPGSLALPSKLVELRRQLAPIPRLYDGEGRLELLPKRKKPGETKETMQDLVGCSPDEADALALAVFGMVRKPKMTMAGGAW